MIAFEASPGAEVIIRGSRVFEGEWAPSASGFMVWTSCSLVLCQVENDGKAVADFFADHGPGKPG
ncbi:MAG: hypothetical protein D6722_29145, partial [Bacteroidetes bacterium]